MKTKILLLVLMVSLLAPPTSATYTNWINGTTNRSDTGGILATVYVFNGSNSSTSNATGFFSICCMENNTNGWTLTAQFNGSDSYTPNTTIKTVNYENLTNTYMTLVVRKPAISSLASSSVTKTGATISWTSNVSNVGNKLIYSIDSNIGTNVYETAWSNSTTSPSFTLSNLRVNTKYYYQASTGNIVNSGVTYTTLSNDSFTTGHGYVEEEPSAEAIVKAVKTPKPTAKPAIDLSAITGKKGAGISRQGVVLLIAFVVVVGIVAYAWQANKSMGKPKRRNKK